MDVLKKRQNAIAWKITDIKGISPTYCSYKINIEEGAKLVVQLLDAGIICCISNNQWVSLVHVVPKKGGMTVVTNEENEIIPTRTVTGWRVCIDYH